MKPHHSTLAAVLFAALCHAAVCAGKPAAETEGLRRAAEEFVTAYNQRDAAALAALFTEEGELGGARGRADVSGRAAIQRHYEGLLSAADAPSLAVEVGSVREVSPGVAVESGTFHLTRPEAAEPFHSAAYTAVLVKANDGAWRIASSREVADATRPESRLGALAAGLEGDWTCRKDGLRLDFSFRRSDSGRFILGEMLATAADAEPQRTTLRIGWDGARKTIIWWTFDDAGGFASGDWTPEGDAWAVQTQGTSASGEDTRSSGRLAFDGKDAVVWSVTGRVADGERLDDVELRWVRQAPAPAESAAP